MPHLYDNDKKQPRSRAAANSPHYQEEGIASFMPPPFKVTADPVSQKMEDEQEEKKALQKKENTSFAEGNAAVTPPNPNENILVTLQRKHNAYRPEPKQYKRYQLPVQKKEVQQFKQVKPFQLKDSPAYQKSQGSLPQEVQAKMENSMGHDFSNVNIHKDSQNATDAGAFAYAQGNDVHFAPGQFKPDTTSGQELIGHELAHVVQQREGRVKPTKVLGKGMAVNEDAGLEREADDMGKKAARSEDLGTGSQKGKAMVGQKKADSGVVQRFKESAWGKFHDTINLSSKGVDADLEFEPGDKVDATKITFSQAVRVSIDDKPRIFDPSQKDRVVDEESSSDGFQLDRLSTKNNPVYGAPSLGAGKGLSDTSGSNSKFRLGHKYDDAGTPKKKNAFMHDSPGHAPVNKSKMEFESAALAIEGTQKDTYYGSVSWGWERDDTGTLKKLPFKIASEGTPTNDFLAAANAWNETKARGTVVTKADDTIAYKWTGAFVEDFKVDKDTKCKRIASVATEHGEYQKSEILNGPHIGKEVYFDVGTLVDLLDGAETVNLPVEDIYEVETKETLNEGLMGPFRFMTELPVGTRVKILDSSYVMGPLMTPSPYFGKAFVEVVQGDFTGHSGWVPYSSIKDENTNVG